MLVFIFSGLSCHSLVSCVYDVSNFFDNLLLLFAFYPLAYLIIINFVGFLAVGREKRQAVLEASEHLQSIEYFRPSGARLFLVGLIGGALGILIGRSYYKFGLKDKTFTIGTIVLLIFNITTIYSFLFTIGAFALLS